MRLNGGRRVGEKRKTSQSVEQTPTERSSRVSHLAISGSSLSPDWQKIRPTMQCDEPYTKQASKSKRYGCSNQNFEAQKRPKFESQGSTKRRPRIREFGHSIVKSATGIFHERNHTRTNRPKDWSQFPFWRFCLFTLFAASLTHITVASHNLHSFNQSANYHKSCIKTHGGIWFGQELWLSEKQLPKLQELGTQFVARSGMEKSVSDGLLIGRPYGGVSIAWSPDLNHLISPLSNFHHKRVVGIELKSIDKQIILICIYMPYFNSSK